MKCMNCDKDIGNQYTFDFCSVKCCLKYFKIKEDKK